MKPLNILLFTASSIIFWQCSIKKNNPTNRYTDYERGCDFYLSNKLDSAFFMLNRYVNTPDDTLKKGTAYRYMGDMQWEARDLHGAEENATGTIRTLDTLNKNHHSELGYAYHLLGNIHLDLRHYDEAIAMYNKAQSFSTDSNFVFELMNGKALALQKKGEYDDAIAVYDSMLLLKPTDQSLVARILDNRIKTKWLQNPGYPGLPEFWRALKIRIDSQYSRGLNASYAHLSDYYVKTNPDSALWYAYKMFQQAQIIQSPDDRIEAIDKIIKLDNFSVLKNWYGEFKRLNDSLQLSRDTTRTRFALIKYDSQKSKADNLELKEHVTIQRLWMYGLAGLSFVIIIGLWSWNDKRKKRIKQEADNAIRDSKLKTSQKVHDVVANGLYRILNELEHSKIIERETLMIKIEGLYEKSRDISYDDIPGVTTINYINQVHDLLKSFADEQTNVFIIGNEQSFWNRITKNQLQQLQLVLNEIMVNMKKHSQAKNVAVTFSQHNSLAVVTYKDDGVGFMPGYKAGNGLNNTVSRIKSLNGEINFEKNDSGGISITISFPLESSNT